MTRAYVYGIVEADPAWTPPVAGLEDAPVRQVAHGDLAALASDLESEPVGRRAEVLRHAEVVDAALHRGPVLPMRFGTVLPGEQSIPAQLLEPRAEELGALLDQVRGLVEVRLRGYYEEDRIVDEVVSAQPGLRRLSDRLRVGQEVAAAIERRRLVDEEHTVERLRTLSEDVVSDEPTSTLMALNVTFLLARDRLARFDAAVADLGEDMAPRVRLRYVGPFPPASFVDLELEGERPWV